MATTQNGSPKKGGKGKKAASATTTTWSLTECALAYLESLKVARKSESTINAYSADLDLAVEVLGGETLIARIGLDEVERFNISKPVMETKTGRPKAEPTVSRSRRVLRLALVFAEQQGAIESAPIPPKQKRESKPVEEAELPPIVEKPKRAKRSTEPAAEPIAEPAQVATETLTEASA